MEPRDFIQRLVDHSEATGVVVSIADAQPDGEIGGVGIGMPRIYEVALRAPKPLVILGLESVNRQTQRGFGELLKLPWVRYLELPFSRAELDACISELKGLDVYPAMVDPVRLHFVSRMLEDVEKNIIHRLGAVLLTALGHSIRGCGQLANSREMTPDAVDLICSGQQSLTYALPKLRDAVDQFDQKLGSIEGIADPAVQGLLREQYGRLADAVADLARFVADLKRATNVEGDAVNFATLSETGVRIDEAFQGVAAVLRAQSAELRSS